MSKDDSFFFVSSYFHNYYFSVTASRFHLDRDDHGQESEDEIWAEDERTPKPVPTATQGTRSTTTTTTTKDSKDKTLEPAAVRNVEAGDIDEYGGSTDVDEPDTDDEIEKSVFQKCNSLSLSADIGLW